MDFESIVERCKKEGKKFKDEYFPADNSSIYYSKSDPNIVWKRPGELCSEPRFMIDGASKYDLDQGKLGNCWFLAAAATLTTQPDLFQQVVPPGQTFTDDNYVGAFHFKFWRFGHWEDVVIDDRLPTKNGNLIFCKNRESANEFWSALLEKAYAKVHGSYEALVSGYSHDALVDFTGGIGEFIDLKNTEDKNKLFKFLARVFKRNSLLCCAIEGSESKLANGLVAGHAYSITHVLSLEVNGSKQKLLRLRNPWGAREWNGAWSDSSPEWANIPEEKRTELGLTVEDDGEFWMPYSDMIANFHTIQICHLTPDCVRGGGGKREWHLSSFNGEWVKGVTAGGCGAPPNQDSYWMNPQYFIELTDADDDDNDDLCTLVVSLMQKYSRARRTTKKKKVPTATLR